MDNHLILEEIRRGSEEPAGAGASAQGGQVPPPSSWKKPLLLFVPLRLGLTELNPIYFGDVKECFEMPQSLGAIGGRPNHALYFIGCCDEALIYLDPHTTQVGVDREYPTTNGSKLGWNRQRFVCSVGAF